MCRGNSGARLCAGKPKFDMCVSGTGRPLEVEWNNAGWDTGCWCWRACIFGDVAGLIVGQLHIYKRYSGCWNGDLRELDMDEMHIVNMYSCAKMFRLRHVKIAVLE